MGQCGCTRASMQSTAALQSLRSSRQLGVNRRVTHPIRLLAGMQQTHDIASCKVDLGDDIGVGMCDEAEEQPLCVQERPETSTMAKW